MFFVWQKVDCVVWLVEFKSYSNVLNFNQMYLNQAAALIYKCMRMSEGDRECLETELCSTVHGVPGQCQMLTRNIPEEPLHSIHWVSLELHPPCSTAHDFLYKRPALCAYKLQLVQKITCAQIGIWEMPLCIEEGETCLNRVCFFWWSNVSYVWNSLHEQLVYMGDWKSSGSYWMWAWFTICQCVVHHDKGKAVPVFN
jgi:hypothetical protein